MATVDIKDASGTTVQIEKPNANGRQAAEASRPVALSTEDLAALAAIVTAIAAIPEGGDASEATLQDILGQLDDPATDTTLQAVGSVLSSILAKMIPAPATEAKQDTLIAKDFATQTTLAELLAKVIAAPATEAKQDTANTALSTLNGKDFATQTTLAAVLAKIIAAPATEAKQDTMIARAVAQLGARTVAQSPAVNLATDDPIAKKIGTRAYNWAGVITRTVTSASAQTAAVGTAGEYEIATDTDCYVLVGSAPTAAATTSRFLAAGSAFTLQLASTDKVAVIRKSADGNLTVLPVAA